MHEKPVCQISWIHFPSFLSMPEEPLYMKQLHIFGVKSKKHWISKNYSHLQMSNEEKHSRFKFKTEAIMISSVAGLLALFLFFHDIITAAAFDDSDSHPCRRQCRPEELPKMCEYIFTIETYATMSRACFYCPSTMDDCSRDGCILASGTQRLVVTANRRLPGPAIEVCKGDRIRVKIYNEMQNGETTSVHWDGIRQRNNPYMDGVPMVTQCPIFPYTMFTYEFDPDLPGTYFWHSQTGFQRADGLAGALIVRDPNDPHISKYDVDDLAPIFLSDWFPNDTASHRFSAYQFGDADDKPTQILVNGLWQASPDVGMPISGPLPPFPVPVAAFEYKLNASLRYRFRAISNAFSLCPISLTIDGHNLRIIAADGQPIKPQITRSLVIMPSERFDFVPYFTGEYLARDAVYWLRAVGLVDCAVNKAKGFAKISYLSGTNPDISNATDATNSWIADVVNTLDRKTNLTVAQDAKPRGISVALLDALEDDWRISSLTPDMSLAVEMDFEPINNKNIYPWIGVRGQHIYTPRFNHITNRMPSVPMLLTNQQQQDDFYCNSTRRKCPADAFCECTHVLDVALNTLVELIFVNTGRSYANNSYPLHLHGYLFRLVGLDRLHDNLRIDEVLEADKNGTINRKFANAITKDTVMVPAGGYAIIRFFSDNPGTWLLHSAVDYDMEMGLALVLRIGWPLQKPLPLPFPYYCGSWRATTEATPSGGVTQPIIVRSTAKPPKCLALRAPVSSHFLNVITITIVITAITII